MNAIWLKYATQADIRFTMVKRGVVDLAASADWTPAAADAAISKDGGNFADCTNTIAIIGGTPTRSVVGWKLTLSATELTCAEALIQVVDAATKAVEDNFIRVFTYGNASAKFAGDWSDAVRLGLTGLANATPGAAGGLLIAGTNAATTFNGTAASGATPATAGLTLAGGAASTTGGGTAAPGLSVTGGAGAASTNGAAEGVKLAGGGTNTVASAAHGLNLAATSTGSGLNAGSGSGATGNGITATANSTNGSGVTLTKAGSGSDLNATSTPLTLAKTTNITGFNDIAATAVVSSGAITTSGGAVSTVTSVTNRVTANVDQVDGAALTAHAAGKVPADVLTIAGTAQTARDIGASVIVATNNDKTGYSLTAAYDAAKTASQAGDQMSLVAAVRPGIRKNTALAAFEFLMTDSTNHLPVTGATVTVVRSIDGGAFAAGTLGAVTELSNGIYKFDWGAGDLNGDVITLRASATGADDLFVTIRTTP